VLAWLDVGDPEGEVAACYLAKELLRETFINAESREYDRTRRQERFR
jgi:hypothetical protein